MAGDIIGGALIGGVTGGTIGDLYFLVMKLLGRIPGEKGAVRP